MRSKLETVDGAGSGLDADLLDGKQGSDFVAGTDSAGGDLSGTFSNLAAAPSGGELRSGSPLKAGNLDFPSIPAGACSAMTIAEPDADLGEILLPTDFAQPW